MNKKVIWFLISCLMVLSLVIASCGTTPTTPTTPKIPTTPTTPKTPTTPTTPKTPAEKELLSPETPKYGGTHTFLLPADIMGFDTDINLQMECKAAYQVNNELINGNWAKGPAGTNETDWQNGFIGRIGLMTGALAESWELPDAETIIYHIRKGVHWQNKAPANGRELTASDVAWSLSRSFFTPTSYCYGAYPESGGMRPKSFTALDKYTVEVKVNAPAQGLMLLVCGDNVMAQTCPDVVAKYGDARDWKNQVGTGPFMMTDYVPSSSVTYQRNPDYWQHDPLHPENQLPYVDTLKSLIIVDVSTRLAALRTGKLDVLGPGGAAITWDDAELLMKTTPQLMYTAIYTAPLLPVGRMDKPELPFKDIRVRQALNMAVDKEAMVKDYYAGHAALLGYPYPPTVTYSEIYTPLNEEPSQPTIEGSECSVQELFTYNPDKAKILLAEAGYPGGFKTTIDCQTGPQADLLAIVRENLLRVGVDMQINPLESGVIRSVSRGRQHKEMILKGSVDYSFPFRLLMVRSESFDNPAYFDTPISRQAYITVSDQVGKDDAVVAKTLKEFSKYSLEQAWGIWLPAPEQYTMWWPWLQNYHGESVEVYDNQSTYTRYIWVDEVMKKAMGY